MDGSEKQAEHVVFYKSYGKYSGEDALGGQFILQAIPFGSVAYMILFFLFKVVNLVKKEIEYRIRERERQERMKNQSLPLTKRILMRMELKRQAKREAKARKLKALVWKMFERIVGLIWDAKQFMFNLFVLDLVSSAILEIS